MTRERYTLQRGFGEVKTAYSLSSGRVSTHIRIMKQQTKKCKSVAYYLGGVSYQTKDALEVMQTRACKVLARMEYDASGRSAPIPATDRRCDDPDKSSRDMESQRDTITATLEAETLKNMQAVDRLDETLDAQAKVNFALKEQLEAAQDKADQANENTNALVRQHHQKMESLLTVLHASAEKLEDARSKVDTLFSILMHITFACLSYRTMSLELVGDFDDSLLIGLPRDKKRQCIGC